MPFANDNALRIPKSHTAILQHGGTLKVLHHVPIPELCPGWLLVRNAAVALNPCDFKMAARFPTPGLKDGSEGSAFSVGDRVFGCVTGNKQDDPESGSFSEYVKIEDIYALKIPNGVSFETTMSFNPACISTIALALRQCLKMPATPDEVTEHVANQTDTVLVYGGSSSIGLLAIQMLKLIGKHIVTTCSPHNFSLVRQYGADAVFDYHSPTCAADIRAYTKNRLKYAIDPFGEVATTALCYETIGRVCGLYCALEHYQESMCTCRAVKHQFVMGPALLGRGVLLPEPYGVEPDPELHEWSKRFYRSFQKVIDGGLLKPLPIKLLSGGFDSILAGLELLKTKQVSGQKLVVKLEN
ncbi:NAD(P)-binding protein [Cadophora sp. DSE1049]|nr:NAD(P)-binding protein [Cadophora sp. DSE1049]